MSEDSLSQIHGLLIGLLDSVLYFDKKQIAEAGGTRLHPSETHLLMCALDGMNFTEMTRRFGISKGAVSQAFARMVAKGVVTVEKDRSLKNAARVTLTPLGEELRVRVEAVRAELGSRLGEHLADYSEAELATVIRFVHDLQAFIDRSMNPPSHTQR
ncbi:MarR family winged helix-turn-helix transcriptional regulator [Streptomyces sp. H51]|uniref:MarR family winged helix-turn-helix transcriptional regulator n=1 Tax=Streptomyces sp. H51 TaxID=3111770 RepID=UPI002D79CDF9|nr:MarR family transcriptional regulator [Streptomyces sp. H51]